MSFVTTPSSFHPTADLPSSPHLGLAYPSSSTRSSPAFTVSGARHPHLSWACIQTLLSTPNFLRAVWFHCAQRLPARRFSTPFPVQKRAMLFSMVTVTLPMQSVVLLRSTRYGPWVRWNLMDRGMDTERIGLAALLFQALLQSQMCGASGHRVCSVTCLVRRQWRAYLASGLCWSLRCVMQAVVVRFYASKVLELTRKFYR